MPGEIDHPQLAAKKEKGGTVGSPLGREGGWLREMGHFKSVNSVM